MIEQPMALSWARWKRLVLDRQSLTRVLEYEALRGVRLDGRILDVGGKRPNNYLDKFVIAGSVEVLNFDHDAQPDIVADLNTTIPVADATYDTVLSLNTFEHVESDTHAFSEMLRVLKPGGSFHVMVPFLYRVHGDPSDFHRHTASHWERTLVSLGLGSGDFRIRPLTWDALAAGYSMFEPRRSRFKALTRGVFLMPGLIAQMRRPEKRWPDYALAYYIRGRKVSA